MLTFKLINIILVVFSLSHCATATMKAQNVNHPVMVGTVKQIGVKAGLVPKINNEYQHQRLTNFIFLLFVYAFSSDYELKVEEFGNIHFLEILNNRKDCRVHVSEVNTMTREFFWLVYSEYRNIIKTKESWQCSE